MATTTNENTDLNRSLGALLGAGGTWTWAYVDASGDREDPQHLAALQRRKAEDALRSAGADATTIDAVMAELEEVPGVPAPVSRYVLLHDGEMVLNTVLPGHMHGPESVGCGPVPDLVPLLAHRPLDVPFIVAEVGREGGGFRVYRLGHAGPADEQRVQGRTDTLHFAKAGSGWKQQHWQQHTEEIWKETSNEVAAAIDECVRAVSPRLIVLAGDIKARGLLREQLSHEARALLSEVAVDPRSDDASAKALVEHVDIALARVVAQRRHDVEDLLRTHDGRGDGEVAAGVGPVVEALQQAQPAVVVLDPAGFGDRTVLALDAAPWVATAPEQSAGAGTLGPVPAAVGIVRAALLTQAEVVYANAAALPGGAPAAALLRWPVGPAVPRG
uniref:Peptide chain release factor 2 n=1 Tax=Neobacillus citreus TaxID=2833578 RepID=A0A942SYQ6_9BACI